MIEIDPRLHRHDRRWTTESCYTALRQPYSKSTATLQQFYGSCTAAPQEFSSDLREQLCSSFTVALCSSMTNFVCSVVRHSRMWCPHDIGRDSWVRGKQETLWSMIPPTKWGMKPSLCGSPCREKTGWPVGEMIVVVIVVVAALPEKTNTGFAGNQFENSGEQLQHLKCNSNTLKHLEIVNNMKTPLITYG